MRRIATLVLGLVLVAGGVQAQAVKCTQSKTTRLVTKASQFSGGVLKSWYVSADSVATTCSGFPTARIDTVKVPGPVVHDTVWVHDSVSPPKDSTVTPPADSGKDSTVTAPPAGVLFSSDWRNGPTDGGQWERASCQGSSLSTIPATGLGFPAGMANVLHVRMGLQVNGGTNCDWVQAHNKWTVPAIGQSIAFRIYARQGVPDSDGDKGGGYAATHPVESGYNAGTGGGFWEWKLGSFANGTFPLEFETSQRGFSFGAPSGPGGHPAALKKFVTYRWEWKFTRVAAGRYDVDLRIYGQDGALLFDKTNTYEWAGSSTATLATLGKNLPIDDDQVRNFRVGINGGFAAGATAFVDYGGAAVCSDWCGAY